MDFETSKKILSENWEKAPSMTEWRHAKTGHIYMVRSHAIREHDLEPLVIYARRDGDPVEIWARPAAEFFDGRFIPCSRYRTQHSMDS